MHSERSQEDRLTGAGEGPGYDLAAWRREIPATGRWVLLNNCSQGPQTLAARRAAEEFLASWRRDGMDWERWLAEVEGAKAELAALIGASPDEVAVTSSVCAATAALASALDFSGERRRVVVSGAEFPGVAHVWLACRRAGAEVAWAPLAGGEVPLSAYEEAIDRRTLVVSACHAFYQNGSRQQVAAIAERAHAAGALVYVDAYQTLGLEPVDVKALGIDLLATGNLKYLLGTAGIAFLYVRRELQARLEPALTGWFGRTDPFAFAAQTLDWAPTARRFETGTPPVLPAYVARAGMALVRSVGLGRIQAWTGKLGRRLLEGGRARGLRALGPGDLRRKTPTTAFQVPGDSHLLEARLRDRGILASARGPAVRLAPHFYNTPEEIDLALDALAELVEAAAAGGAGGAAR